MARGHLWLPKKKHHALSKSDLLARLAVVDSDSAARDRILMMESCFRRRMQLGLAALPTRNARFDRFRTSPYVLLMQALLNSYTRISEIEHDILPAKTFSSMETSAGRMIEEVVLPVYGWETVTSAMHTSESSLDGRKVSGDVLTVATLKSGPACLNDEMAENFADAILAHAPTWASEHGTKVVEFTYGVLYGTTRQSNKKDWHILRNLWDKVGGNNFIESPQGRWRTSFVHEDIEIRANIRIGTAWWEYLGGNFNTNIEFWTALIRACINVGPADPPGHKYVIQDLGAIVSAECAPRNFNVSLLQQSQLQWLFFIARHFTDELVP